jgi:hypothetical protein
LGEKKGGINFQEQDEQTFETKPRNTYTLANKNEHYRERKNNQKQKKI